MKGIAIALLIAACSDVSSGEPPGSFQGPALVSMPTDLGRLVVEMRTAPSPVIRGNTSVELTVHDAATGAAVDGLSVAVVPWMASHAHGSSIVPIVTAEGGGRYLVSNVGFFMPGTWQLRTTFEGTISDRVAPTVDVP
jgi:hypothetical protein